jgi:lactate racemase
MLQVPPLGILAYSTHMRGSGVMENGLEKPNVEVTLVSQIPPNHCAWLNLGYIILASIYVVE